MDKFEIEGGISLNGTVMASGSKNAALPILFATILSSRPICIRRVPKLKDIETTLSLLAGVGGNVSFHEDEVKIDIPKLLSTEAPYDLVRTMRASILMLGPLLAREKKAKVSLPGGCAIGTRPVDIHLEGLEKLGAKFHLDAGYIVGECARGLRGAKIHFRFPSVGATENIMMAASLAEGETILTNVAREPEIEDLARMLNGLGAKISGAGSDTIIINGVNALSGGEVKVMFDRIEAGTLLLCGAMTNGRVRVNGVDPLCLSSFLEKLNESGLSICQGLDWVEVSSSEKMHGVNFITEPYPGFPTDLQAQFMAYLANVSGESNVQENIFENRFMHVPELVRMGADIRVEGGTAEVKGKSHCYQGATVMATDLRASASLVLAGLAARGKTSVRRIYHLDRGYESLEKKLGRLGARVWRKKEE